MRFPPKRHVVSQSGFLNRRDLFSSRRSPDVFRGFGRKTYLIWRRGFESYCLFVLLSLAADSVGYLYRLG